MKSKVVSAGVFASLSGFALAAVGFTVWKAVDSTATGTTTVAAVAGPATLQGAPGELRAPDFRKIRAAQVRASAQPNDQRGLMPADDSRIFQRDNGSAGTDTYIVVLKDLPVASYDGRVKGLAATSPTLTAQATSTFAMGGKRHGNRLDAKSETVRQYVSYLKARQGDFVSKAMGRGVNMTVQAQFQFAVNGMAARMTRDNAERLAGMAGVRRVYRARTMQLQTDAGPQMIGAPALWDNTIPTIEGNQGEGVVVGIIDTGINTDHPSFAAVGADGYEVQNPRGDGVFLGDCVTTPTLCNNKLIGVYTHPQITNSYLDWQFQSPPYTGPRPANGEDYNGHGSHTASTVAGNVLFDVPLLGAQGGNGDGFAAPYTFGRISGVAPHANIISYQACYPGGAGDLYAGCPEAPLLSAIDRAIADGVDVINYSIGGSEALPWDDAIELAFLNARAAGVFVAASAGNSGRQARDHASPWLTVVAASSNARKIESTPKYLNNFSGGDYPLEREFDGKSISGAVTGPIVSAASVPNPDANPWATNNGPYPLDLCAEPYPAGTFAPNTIVVCKRGIVARTSKAQNVMAGGAGGMVLYNDPAGSFDQQYQEIADVMPIPAIHIMSFEGEELVAWLGAGTGHSATITASAVERLEVSTEYMADFSSRGPSATIRDTMFPHVSAPGIDVYAAFADEHPFSASPASADFAFLSGTSMASPHVAGAAALLSRSHPDWTPAELQSALMTTTNQEVKSGEFDVTNASYYDFGAGRINVAAAANVGLVLNETAERYLAANVAEGGDVRGLNTPFLVNKACRNPCSWMRTFRATRDGTWNLDASIFKVYDAISGQDIPENHIKFTVTPATFTLRAGQTQTVIVTSDVRDFQTYFGNLSSHLFSGAIEFYGELKAMPADGTAGPSQHLPLILAYDSGDLPLSVDINAHRNQGDDQVIDIQTKSITSLTLRTYGLVKPTVTQVTLAAEMTPNDFYDAFEFGVPNPTPGAGAGVFWTTVPEGAIQLNAEILDYFAGKFNNSGDVLVGIDLNSDGMPQPDELVCRSAAGAINNWCTLKRPRAGRYWTILRNYIDPFFPQEPVTFRFAQAVVLPTAAGNITLTGPQSNDGTKRFNLTMQWNVPGAKVGDVYYGAFDVGTDAANAGNIGLTSIRWERKRDDVVLDASQARAKAGDIIDFNLDVLENDTELARGYTLNATLPEGLSIVPGSVKPSAAIASQVVVDGRTIRLAGTQASTKRVPRTYTVTTNASSSSCKLREVTFDGYTTNAGGYIRMPIDYDTGIRGGQDEAGLVIPFRALFNDSSRHVPLFNRDRNEGVIGIDAAGYVNLDGRPNWDRHFLLSEGSFNTPNEMIAPYWNSMLTADDSLDGRVKFAYTRDEKHLFVEWENLATFSFGDTWWDPPVLNEDQDYNFEVQMSTELSFEPGESEFVFAYDRMEGPNDLGSIGLRGFTGPVDAFGPYNYPFLAAQVAYEDALVFPNGTQYPRVASAAVPGRMICLDYDGPERSRFNVRFQARVDESAAGATLEVVLQNGLAGADNVVVKKTIAVNGNVSIAGLSDMTTVEDVPVTSIPVYYVDNDGSANRISVSGEHVVATVHGNEAGSTFDLAPEKDWSGTTTVTVSVTDLTHTSDSVSTTFQLTVTPAGDGPVAAVTNAALTGTTGSLFTLDGTPSHDPDGDALTYQWTQLSGGALTIAGATTSKATFTPPAAGSYSFRLTVSDGSGTATQDVTATVAAPPAPPAAPAPPAPPSRGGGGALDLWLLAALASFLAWRARPRFSARG